MFLGLRHEHCHKSAFAADEQIWAFEEKRMIGIGDHDVRPRELLLEEAKYVRSTIMNVHASPTLKATETIRYSPRKCAQGVAFGKPDRSLNSRYERFSEFVAGYPIGMG